MLEMIHRQIEVLESLIKKYEEELPTYTTGHQAKIVGKIEGLNEFLTFLKELESGQIYRIGKIRVTQSINKFNCRKRKGKK